MTGHTVRYHTIAQTKRSVSADYQIYRTSDAEQVWVSQSSNSRSRKRTAQSNDGYPSAPDYGPAPTLSRVLRSMTTAAVKELPKEDMDKNNESDGAPLDSSAESAN